MLMGRYTRTHVCVNHTAHRETHRRRKRRRRQSYESGVFRSWLLGFSAQLTLGLVSRTRSQQGPQEGGVHPEHHV